MVAISNFFSKIPGRIYLWLAVIIFAAANSVTRKLTEIGSQNSIDSRNPISFCNILFIGNICALLVLILIYRHQLSWRSFRQFSFRDWSSIAAVAILAGALAPAFIFVALSETMVNNVVLVGRIELPLTLILSLWLLRERTHRWEIIGALVSFVGVVITVVFQSTGENAIALAGFGIGQGELLAVIAAIALAISNIISKVSLTRISVGAFTIIRTALGTVIFFFAALFLYGRDHFGDIFSPFLWKWMLVYGTIIVALGQSFWLTGLKKTSGTEASLAGAINPIAAIVAAYLILGELPTAAQYLGGGIILSGVLSSELGTCCKPASTTDKNSHALKMETGIGFKGI